MMAKPIRALELHYPMIQFLIMSIIIWTAPWAGMKQWIRVLIGYQSEQNDPALSDVSGYGGCWYWYGILTTSFFFFFHVWNRPKRTQKRNLPNNHIHLTLPQYAYIPGTSYVAKLRVLSGRGNGRDRARQTTPSAEQAIGIQYLSPSEVDNVLGKSVQLHQNPFTNHHLPGFFAYPARHRRE